MNAKAISDARDLIAKCQEARIAQREAEANAALAVARRESYALMVGRLKREGATYPRRVIAEAAEKCADAEATAWTSAAWALDDDARDSAKHALWLALGAETRDQRDDASDAYDDARKVEPDLTIDQYAARIVDAAAADRAA